MDNLALEIRLIGLVLMNLGFSLIHELILDCCYFLLIVLVVLKSIAIDIWIVLHEYAILLAEILNLAFSTKLMS